MFSALLLSLTLQAQSCTRYCDPAVSKPCGRACISKSLTCRKSWTTACEGKRPATSKPGFEKPTFVSEPPKGE